MRRLLDTRSPHGNKPPSLASTKCRCSWNIVACILSFHTFMVYHESFASCDVAFRKPWRSPSTSNTISSVSALLRLPASFAPN